MKKLLIVFVLSILSFKSIVAQTTQQLVSKDLLRAVTALNNKDYVASVNYLDKCQSILGDEIIPRIEELYIQNFEAFKNPLLIDKHLQKYFSVVTESRKGYIDKVSLFSENKKELNTLLGNLKKENVKQINSMNFALKNISIKETLTNDLIKQSSDTLALDKNKVEIFSDDVKLLDYLIPTKKNAASYFYLNKNNDSIISKVGYNARGFSDGLALIDKCFINKLGNNVLDLSEYDEVTFFYKGISFVRKDDKWGAINTDGAIIIPVSFDDTYFLPNEDLVYVFKGNKYGFYNSKGVRLTDITFNRELNDINRIRPLFSNIRYEENLILTKLGYKYGYINNKGDIKIKHQFKSASNFYKGISVVEKDDKWGVINTLGKMIVPFKYDNISVHKRSIRAYNSDKNKMKASFYDLKGNLLLPSGYNLVSNNFLDVKYSKSGKKLKRNITTSEITASDSVFLNKKNKYYYFNTSISNLIEADFQVDKVLDRGIIKIKRNDKFGLISYGGEFLISSVYDELLLLTPEKINDRSEFLFSFKRGDITGFVNIQGEEFLNFKYNLEQVLANDFFIAKHNGKKGIVDSASKVILPFDNDNISRFDSNSCIFSKAKKIGVFDFFNNKIVIPCEYSTITTLKNELLQVEKNNLLGFVNLKGEIVLPIENTAIKQIKVFNEKNIRKSCYLITRGNKIGLADERGSLLTPIIYDKLNSDFSGNILFEKGKTKGYLDTNGNELLKSNYIIKEVISNDCLIAKNSSGKNGIINSNEEIKIPFDYSFIENINGKGFNVKKGNKYGVINMNNSIMVPFLYEFITIDLATGKLIVKRNGKMGVLDSSNKLLIPLEYDVVQPTNIKGAFKVKLDNTWKVIKI